VNPDGSLDTAFDPGANNAVNTFAVQGDGKILVGGSFTRLGQRTRNYIGRLNPGGSLDAAFNPGADGPVAVGSRGVRTEAVQPDGKILVGGSFDVLADQPRKCLGRLTPDGRLDTTFDAGAGSSSPLVSVESLAVQADGKILVAGFFTVLGGQQRSGFGRLNAD